MLAPLGTITSRAQAMNASDLSARFDTSGPADELVDLAHTFNAMLARIQSAFASERQLIANMSHELRTPLATQRAVLEVAMADNADDDVPNLGELVVASRVALEQNERAAAIIDAMLVLAKAARSEERVDEPVDLAGVVERVVAEHHADAETATVDITRDIPQTQAVVTGEATLLEQLVANLVRNAIVHNTTGGSAEVRVDVGGTGGDGAGDEFGRVGGDALDSGMVELASGELVGRGGGDGLGDGQVRLTVVNTGPEIPQAVVSDLVKPFRRSTAARTGSHKGQGLGLAIVQAVADYHAATLKITPRTGGGLQVELPFPTHTP
jgi:signal transduction histidine kinase